MSKDANFHLGGCWTEHRNFKVGAPLFHGQCVMLDPADETCVIPWDGMTEECRIGYVRCVSAVEGCEDLYIQSGDCVDIRIERPLGGKDMGCSSSGWVCDESGQTIWFEKSPKGDIKYYCDPTGTEEIIPVGKLSPGSGGSSSDFEMVSGWVCDEDGTLHYFVKDVVVNEKSGEGTHTVTYYTGVDCNTESVPVGATRPSGPKQLKELVIETRKIVLPVGVEVTLDPIPADAIGAEIKLYGNPCCSWKYTYDGSPAQSGIQGSVGCDDRIALGCVKESESDEIELQNFKVISDDDCEESCMSVTFYKQS